MENGKGKLTKLRIELADLECISSEGCPGCRKYAKIKFPTAIFEIRYSYINPRTIV